MDTQIAAAKLLSQQHSIRVTKKSAASFDIIRKMQIQK